MAVLHAEVNTAMCCNINAVRNLLWKLPILIWNFGGYGTSAGGFFLMDANELKPNKILLVI